MRVGRIVGVVALVGMWGLAAAAGLEALRADLAGPDGNARRKAAEALAGVGGPEAVRLLAEAYRGETEDAFGVKAACAEALGRIGLPEAAGPLAAMLSDRDYWVRKKAVEALERIPGAEALGALRRATDDRDPRVRAAAFGALGRRGDGPEAIAPGWHDPDDRVRAAALGALVAVRAPGAEELLAGALASDAWRVRLRAATILAGRGDPRGREVLAEALRRGEHAGAAVREWSCLGEEAVPALVALWADPSVPAGEKGRILDALERLDCPASTRFFLGLAADPGAAAGERARAASVVYDRREALDADQVRAVAGWLGQADPNLPAVALQILLDRGGPGFLASIAPLADHPNEVVRHFALRNLAAHGGPEYEPLFLKALHDPKGANVRLALETLARIGTQRAVPALEPFLGERKYARYARAALDAIRERGR